MLVLKKPSSSLAHHDCLLRAFLSHRTVFFPHIGKARHVGELIPQEQLSENRSWCISFLAGWVKMLGVTYTISLRAPARGAVTSSLMHPVVGFLTSPDYSPLLIPMFLGSLTKQFATKYLPQGPPSQQTQVKDRRLLYRRWIITRILESKYLGSSLCFHQSSCVILGNIFIFLFVKFSCGHSIEKCDYPIE